jgi:hypothetical protein
MSESGWRGARDLRKHPNGAVNDSWFDEVERDLRPTEGVRLVAAPQQWYSEHGALNKFPVGLAITIQRVVMFKKKMFGGIRSVEYPILDFTGYAVNLFMGGGPSWELIADVQRGRLKLVFETRDEADSVAEYINSGVALARAGVG